MNASCKIRVGQDACFSSDADMRYQVHGHASFAVMHAERISMQTDGQESSNYGCIETIKKQAEMG